MLKKKKNTLNNTDEVLSIPAEFGKECLMNDVSDVPTDFESECFEDTVPADSDDENIDYADDVPDVPTPFDDVNSTLPDATAGVKHP